VTDGIIKHIIHERHRHQREHNNNRSRGTVWNDREKRRKHGNTRRTDVSKQSGYFCLYFLFYYNFLLFYYLEKGSKETGIEDGDRLVKKFRPDELQGVRTDNRYHSPEVSETDEENSNKRKIVIRDVRWRSSTVSLLFFKPIGCI
jgi:hypothetical protein